MVATGRLGDGSTGRAENADALPAEPARARANGTEAFEASVGPHWSSLVRRLVLVLGDRAAAEDVAQDAYLRAFRSWDRFEGPDVRAWLYTIALRLAFNERRRHRRWLAAVRRVEPILTSSPTSRSTWPTSVTVSPDLEKGTSRKSRYRRAWPDSTDMTIVRRSV